MSLRVVEPHNGNGGLTKGGALVVAMLALLGGVFLLGWRTRGDAPSQAEVADLRSSIERLNTRLDSFNTRLSWLEGATSGAVRPPPVLPVQTSGPGK